MAFSVLQSSVWHGSCMDLVRSLPPWSVDRLLDVFLVPLDITRLFNNVLLQQTQPLDSRNKETMTYIYTKWCVHSLLIGWGFHLHKRLLRIEPEFVIMYFIFAVSINFFANHVLISYFLWLLRYLEVVLRRASAGHMLWSEHLQAMISSGEGNDFAPEQYTDPRGICWSNLRRLN